MGDVVEVNRFAVPDQILHRERGRKADWISEGSQRR